MTSFQLCVHLAGNPSQPLALLDENGAETFLCGPCVAERIEALLTTTAPATIPRLVTFNRCNHFDNDATCGLCYAGVMGYLMSAWSYLKLQGDGHVANRLSTAVKELARHHGRVPLGVIQEQFETV